jgi:hypothetical protein
MSQFEKEAKESLTIVKAIKNLVESRLKDVFN